MVYRITLALILIACSTGCSRVYQKMTLQGQTQGTYYAITYYDYDGRNFRQDIDSILRAFDACASLWNPNSILSRVNKNDTAVILDDWFMDLFNKSKEISHITSGSFDMTVGPLVNAWGFGFENRLVMDSLKVDSLLRFTGYRLVEMENGRVIKKDPRLRIDFNAIAQGYAVDLLAAFLESRKIHIFLIDIGGEVFARGLKPDGSKWRVGIEKPAARPSDDRRLKAVLELKDEAIATSGNYRKFIEEDGVRYSHAIDPTTGYPTRNSLLSVSVRAKSCWEADAYATALLVMGLDKSLAFLSLHPELDAYMIYSDATGELKTEMTQGIHQILAEENE
ncbi:MAG: FAD:protein FMN transferase [Lentimicrobiaceae bacterium]|nr:FAD:protein FMN transferase [Lentimicrobiaceae bacterium]